MIRSIQWIGWRVTPRLVSQIQCASSSASSVPAPVHEANEKTEETNSLDSNVPERERLGTVVSEIFKKRVQPTSSSSLVAAAFAALKNEKLDIAATKKPTPLEEKIANADSVEDLLKIADSQFVTRHHCLKIVSILADWTSVGRVKLKDFETDLRFVKLCRTLGKGLTSATSHGQGNTSGVVGDLATVLNVTGDDEAAKLVAGINLPQMVKVMSTLAQKRRRSMPLLRSLAYNISRQSDQLDIKQASDILYGMAVLNFPDEILLEKISGDLYEVNPSTLKSSVVGSIITSMGLLRYKNPELLDMMSEWMINNVKSCRTHDLVSLLLTLAMVNYTPSTADTLFDVVSEHITRETVSGAPAWLDVVWSLAVLNRVTPSQLSSVLNSEFILELLGPQDDTEDVSFAPKLKLLNINAVAQFATEGYEGPLLPLDSKIHSVPLNRSKDKKLFVSSVFETLSNLLRSGPYLRTNIDTGMGFLLDGECMLDKKCNPLPLEEKTDTNTSGDALRKSNVSDRIRIGILTLDYHDLCRSSLNEPNGVMALSIRLLERRGYKVLSIPHVEYNPRDKLVKRVQYLEQRLKTLVKSS